MDKKYAFLFAILLVGLIASDIFIFTFLTTEETAKERVIISKITDGDTLKLTDGRVLRLININSPEKGMPNYDLSIIYLKDFENKSVEIEIVGTDKYERNLARIYIPEYLNLGLVEKGLASKFLVQKSELSLFAEAEERAIDNSLGIWKRSEFFGCINSEIDEIEEIVRMINSCPEINLNDWMIKDESRKVYNFGNISFDSISLHSSQGEDNKTDIFWGSNANIWNNDRDGLYLFDSEGRIVDYETYGY